MAEPEVEVIVEPAEGEGEETTIEPADTDDAEKWKALSRKNEREMKKALAELDKLRTASMSEQEKAVALARAEGRSEALKESNKRLLHAEVRAAASGVLADPDDAIHLIDLDQFETEGEIDRTRIKSALADLVKSKPYLSPQPGNGSGEGGARGAAPLALGSDPLLETLKRAVGAS